MGRKNNRAKDSRQPQGHAKGRGYGDNNQSHRVQENQNNHAGQFVDPNLELQPGSLDLAGRAKIEMLANNFAPVFEPPVVQQATHLEHEKLVDPQANAQVKDLRHLLWSSIDNIESRDLDQIEYAEELPDGTVRLLVGIADVDAYVPKDSPIDKHAAVNTTSVYTGVVTFPMLPEQLSFDLTSLLPDQDRRAMVVEMQVDKGGQVVKSDAYPALVRNQAKLDYVNIGNWLEKGGGLPDAVAKVPGLSEQLLLQSKIKERIHAMRENKGSLTLHTPEATTVADNGKVLDLELVESNPARDLIENFMIMANISTSKFLELKGIPSLRRIVKTPVGWPRIVEVAAQYGEKLPDQPSAPALAQFLIKRRAADKLRFPDLSLTIVKLLGRGEYIVEVPGQKDEGHFALAVHDYTHATAPNRRYPDLVTQRLLKAVMNGSKTPYSLEELNEIALNCTRMEAAEKKVERTMRKVSAALLMSKQIGKQFDGIVTGVKEHATFVRLLKPPVEGCIVSGGSGLKVGDEVHVELIHVDADKSYIDFALVRKSRSHD